MARQFHYVVMYDESTGAWTIEDDTRYLDGNIYDTVYAENTGDGWFFAEDNTDEAVQDLACREILLQKLEA